MDLGECSDAHRDLLAPPSDGVSTEASSIGKMKPKKKKKLSDSEYARRKAKKEHVFQEKRIKYLSGRCEGLFGDRHQLQNHIRAKPTYYGTDRRAAELRVQSMCLRHWDEASEFKLYYFENNDRFFISSARRSGSDLVVVSLQFTILLNGSITSCSAFFTTLQDFENGFIALLLQMREIEVKFPFAKVQSSADVGGALPFALTCELANQAEAEEEQTVIFGSKKLTIRWERDRAIEKTIEPARGVFDCSGPFDLREYLKSQDDPSRFRIEDVFPHVDVEVRSATA